jgi:hypothetical protein
VEGVTDETRAVFGGAMDHDVPDVSSWLTMRQPLDTFAAADFDFAGNENVPLQSK